MAKRLYEKTLASKDLVNLPVSTEMQHIFRGTGVTSANEILWAHGDQEIGFRLSPETILLFQTREVGEKTYVGTIDECETIDDALTAFRKLELAGNVPYNTFFKRLNRTMRNIKEF